MTASLSRGIALISTVTIVRSGKADVIIAPIAKAILSHFSGIDRRQIMKEKRNCSINLSVSLLWPYATGWRIM